MKNEKGFTLVEVLVAVALLGLISVNFLGGLSVASKGGSIVDERETAKNLAESQMECVKDQAYAASYVPTPIPGEYSGYSANISVSNIASKDGNIQKITVKIAHQGKEAARLESYKVN